jgi:hypothetical protein
VPLHAVAHGRAGDKGNRLNVSLFPYDPALYPLLAEQVTAERVHACFRHRGATGVRRYELPLLAALNFVIENALGGGVTVSLAQDMHGKSLSFLMLDIDLPERDVVHGRRGPAATRRS